MAEHVHTAKCHPAHSEVCPPGCERPLCNRKKDSSWLHPILTGRRPEDQPLVRRVVIGLLAILTALASQLALSLKSAQELNAKGQTALTEVVSTGAASNEKVAAALDRLTTRLGEKSTQQVAFEAMINGIVQGRYKCRDCPACPPCPPATVVVQQPSTPPPTVLKPGSPRPW